jgi:hypothetical protein
VLLLINHFEQLLRKFKKRIRSEVNGMITFALAWIEHFRQLLILVKTVTALPDKNLHESVTMRAEDFHPSIFTYLEKYCQPRQAE